MSGSSATDYVVDGVYRDSPISRRKLAIDLIRTYNGKLNKGEATALTTVMAMTLEGHVLGYWGDLFWKHEAGQFDSGKVTYNW